MMFDTKYSIQNRIEANRPLLDAAQETALELANSYDLRGFKQASRRLQKLRKENHRLICKGIKLYWRDK